MIFVTIGTQEPFNRLIKAMDQLAFEMKGIEFVAQTVKGSYKPEYMKNLNFLSPSEFNYYFQKAELIVSHAGMGTILSALVAEKPILVMPRLFLYKEHRSDHQIATTRAFEKLKYINTAYNEIELKTKVKQMIHNSISLHKIGNFASEELIQDIKEFIDLESETLEQK